MGFVSGLFSGGQGSAFQAQGPTASQLQTAQDLSGQALGTQQGFVNQLAGQTSGAVAAQQQLQAQLQQQAQGQGPNPAAAALAQQTAANTQTGAALAAGQRGASQNAGLIARQVGQQTAATQQAGVGQAATLEAQQQLAAQGQLQNLAASQIGQVGSAEGQQTGSVLSNQGQLLNAQGAQQSANAGIANTNAKGQQQIAGGVAGGLGSALFGASGGMVPSYDAGGAVAPAGSGPSVPSSWSGRFLAGLTNPGGTNTPQQKATPVVGDSTTLSQGSSKAASGAMGTLQKIFGGITGGGGISATPDASAAGAGATDLATDVAMVGYKGGEVKAMLSPGEKYIPPQKVAAVAKGKESLDKAGKTVPGKPKIKGDSLKNDIVPATLKAGGVVIPNHIMQAKDPGEKARKFVEAILAKQSLKRAA